MVEHTLYTISMKQALHAPISVSCPFNLGRVSIEGLNQMILDWELSSTKNKNDGDFSMYISITGAENTSFPPNYPQSHPPREFVTETLTPLTTMWIYFFAILSYHSK